MENVPEDDILEQTLVWMAENKAGKEEQRRAEEKAEKDRREMEAKYGNQ